MAELNWSDSQWQRVKDAVTEAFGKASVASAFLPMYGPLSGGTETVRNELVELDKADGKKAVKLDADHDAANVRLVNLRVKVELSTEQVADETLSNALLLFRRAANVLAQEEDRIVFNGYDPAAAHKSTFVSNDPKKQKGLVQTASISKLHRGKVLDSNGKSTGIDEPVGPLLLKQVVEAMRTLENNFNPGPFAGVLGDDLFVAAHEPSSYSLVLPSDRITPLLRGPLLRSGPMDAKTGIVVSLGSNAVDLVVGTPPTVQFLQRTEDAKFLFRVYTRFALRIRDKDAPPVAVFHLQ